MLEINKFISAMDKLSEDQRENFIKNFVGNIGVIRKDMPGFHYLEKIQNIIVNDGVDSSVYDDKPYLVTTRNQRYIEKVLPKNAESAFVILSSGDTLFELLSRDVKKIVAVDVNDLQLLIFNLRVAAMKTLNAKDFENFLINYNDKKFMSLDVFKTVKDALNDEDIANVWKKIITINPQEDLVKHLFKGVGGDVLKTLYCLPYLKRKASYYELREKIEKAEINIKLEDALTYLINNTNEKFDYIDITNILLFIYQYGCKNNEKDFLEKLKHLRTIFDKNLNVGGTFVLDYLFGLHIEDIDDPNLNIDELIRKIYCTTIQYLNNEFDLESIHTDKLIGGFGEKSDTVIYTKKKS